MYTKHIVHIDDKVIALKFNIIAKKFTIGWYSKFTETLYTLLREYFDVEKSLVTIIIQVNKIKFEISFTLDKYMGGLKQLEAQGYVVKEVRSHNNLMR